MCMSHINYNSYEIRMPGTRVKKIATVICEAAALTVAIVTVWVLMFIPVVLYFSLVSTKLY